MRLLRRSGIVLRFSKLGARLEMYLRAIAIAGVALLLIGCSDEDWDKATTFNSIENPKMAAQSDVPAEAPLPVETASVTPPAQGYAAAPSAAPPSPPSEQVASAPTAGMEMVPASVETTTTTTTLTRVPLSSPLEKSCRQAARNTSDVADRDGFDLPAQQQAAEAVYRQCIAFYSPH
jgi:hypothetical protein